MQTVLVHGASIGELVAAESVVARLRAERPGLHFVYSHTSASVTRWPAWPTSDVRRLPLPLPGLMSRWLDDIAPSLILLSRGDLWPGMLRAARRRSIPVTVIGGRIGAASGRLRWPARALLTPGVRGLARVAAVSIDDADRWRRLGAPADRITVTGDPAIDRLLERTPDAAVTNPLRAWAGGEPVLIVGSMEPSDRAIVSALLAESPRAIIVPHDPERTPRLRVPAVAWSPGQPVPDARHIVIPVRGFLADCYHVGRAAYVGGGFSGKRHSMNEPAAARIPTLCGPEASEVLVGRWRRWRDDADVARAEGATARVALEADAGAAARSTALLTPLLAATRTTKGAP